MRSNFFTKLSLITSSNCHVKVILKSCLRYFLSSTKFLITRLDVSIQNLPLAFSGYFLIVAYIMLRMFLQPMLLWFTKSIKKHVLNYIFCNKKSPPKKQEGFYILIYNRKDYSFNTSTVTDPLWLSLLMFKIYIPELTLRLMICP
jgi:hypothetical protein